jgi:putative membrane protein
LLIRRQRQMCIRDSVGIVVLFLAIFLMEKLTRFSITKEIVDEHNTALAIIVGAIVIGVSIIIAASISG